MLKFTTGKQRSAKTYDCVQNDLFDDKYSYSFNLITRSFRPKNKYLKFFGDFELLKNFGKESIWVPSDLRGSR